MPILQTELVTGLSPHRGRYYITLVPRKLSVRAKFHNIRSAQCFGACSTHVRSWVKSGRHLLALSVSQFDPTRTLQSLAWSNCLLRPRPQSFVGLSSIRVRDVSVLEVRIVAGRSSTLVSNQARCIQVAA